MRLVYSAPLNFQSFSSKLLSDAASTGSINGKIAALFFAAKALLFSCVYKLAVDHKRRNCIVTLADSVLADIETRPVRVPEGLLKAIEFRTCSLILRLRCWSEEWIQ
jgi:hypothetical protein